MESKEVKNNTLSLRKNEIDVFCDFLENATINIEILRHSIFQCLYSTQNDETFNEFISKFDDNDKAATVHFKKSLIGDKYISFCTNHQVILLPTSSKEQINLILTKVQNKEIYLIDETDKNKLLKFENSKFLRNFADETKLEKLRENLAERIRERFEVFNAVQSVMVNYRTTFLTYFYLTEDVISAYYDISPQPLDFESDSELTEDAADGEAPTIIPFYYEEKDKSTNVPEVINTSLLNSSFNRSSRNNKLNSPVKHPKFLENNDVTSNKDNLYYRSKDNRTLSLRKNEIDVFCDFESNATIDIEILRHSIFKCLYSTQNDEVFNRFISEFGSGDSIAIVHFKKSVIFDKYASFCTNDRVLLLPASSDEQINAVLAKIQSKEIYLIEEKDSDKLSKYENSKLLKKFASGQKLEELRETLHSRINERFDVFNNVQSVMVCYRTTFLTYFYLTEEVISVYFDLTIENRDVSFESSSSEIEANEPAVIPFYYEEKSNKVERLSDSNSNFNLSQDQLMHKVPSLVKNEIDIFRDFEQNVTSEIEVLPNSVFKCLYSTDNNDAFHQFVSEIGRDSVATIHFKKSMIYEKYFSLCTDHHALLLPYEQTEQINEVLLQIQNSEIFCITEKDRDKLHNFENSKHLKKFAPNENLEILRETLHARINERFEVFNTAQSVMICYRTTYMTFFYLTEEVLSTYYDVKTRPHKVLKIRPHETNYQTAPIKPEQLAHFEELFNSLEDKIKALHQSISPNEAFIDSKSSLIDAKDFLAVHSDHQIKKGLSDCIKTYKSVNQQISEAEKIVDDFINRAPRVSLLPSLNPQQERQIEIPQNDEIEDSELKELKYCVEVLQNKLDKTNREIANAQALSINVPHELNFSPRKFNASSPARTLKTTSPTRSFAGASPRAMRNKIRVLEKRVEDGDVTAMYSLGACYALGDGAPEDKKKALQFYTMAAEKGNKNAQYAAAACYSYGKGTEVDKNKAFELYLNAAKQGHPKAQFAVAHFYEYGQGGAEKSHEIAKEWYRKAAEQGHVGARKFLDECQSEDPLQNDY